MQNLKKVSFTALIGLLILLLAACSAGQNPTANNNDSPQTTLVIITSTPRDTATPTMTPTPVVPILPASELAGIQLDLWYLWPAGQTDTLVELIERFNQENEYDLEIIPHSYTHPDDFQTALTDAVISANPPDIVLAHPIFTTPGPKQNCWLT